MRAVVLLGLAFLSIAACAEKKALPTARGSALADSADQVMFGLKFSLTSQGISRALLNADTAYFFDENTRAELERVHTTFFTTTGVRDAVLTSRRGTYNTRLATMVARENVVVVSEDGRRLETSELIYNQGRNEISSDSAFVLTEPNRRLEGIGFRSDPNMNNIRILKGFSGVARNISTGPAAPSGQAPVSTPPSATPAAPTTTSTPQRLR
ncbi:MAG TPA: LPS export ABC transporter periplasmic protein LptC [Gemmatimonadaceae bacterium]|nr:LPS export ABC transporter periplasmic protein LptC [Gemmatimonadaceae bacterium]